VEPAARLAIIVPAALQEISMTLTVAHLSPLIALAAGILIVIGLIGLNSIHHFIR
jgi:hypothetical protein